MLTLMLAVGYIIGAFLAYFFYVITGQGVYETQTTYQQSQRFSSPQYYKYQYHNRYSTYPYDRNRFDSYPYSSQRTSREYHSRRYNEYSQLTIEEVYFYTFCYWGPVGSLVAFAVWFIQMLVAYYSGGNILLSLSNAQKITKNDHPQLYNVVEEMKIAGRLPAMPEIYIIDDPAMNAFATGRSPEHSAVAVTRGLLTYMNRDQLQGVIAHEISHIINRDTMYMTMLAVSVGTIILLVEGLRTVVGSAIRGAVYGGRYTSRRDREGFGAILIVLVIIYIFALILSVVAPLLAMVIYFASSRRREYLADATSVVLTRHPEGLASALEKIASSYIANPVKEVNKLVAPMYIVNPLELNNLSTSSIFSTHPPLEKRIQILRAIAKNPSFANYEQAWKQIEGKRTNLLSTPPTYETGLPTGAVASDSAKPLTQQSPTTPLHPMQQNIDTDIRKNARSAGNALLKAQKYRFLKCHCGVFLKIPPSYKGKVTCPRCKYLHIIEYRLGQHILL